VCVSPWAMAAAARYCGLSFRGPTRALLLAHGNTVELWNACWMMCSHSHLELDLDDEGAAHDVCAVSNICAQLFRWPLLPRRPGCLPVWMAGRPHGEVTAIQSVSQSVSRRGVRACAWARRRRDVEFASALDIHSSPGTECSVVHVSPGVLGHDTS
jgi:hypothetical protein